MRWLQLLFDLFGISGLNVPAADGMTIWAQIYTCNSLLGESSFEILAVAVTLSALICEESSIILVQFARV